MIPDSFAQDVRRAARVLWASPGLLVVSVLSLGLGLGVNLTLFSAIRAVFFYTPSIAAAERVVGVEPGNSNQFSYLNYGDLLRSNIFESVGRLSARAVEPAWPRSGGARQRPRGDRQFL